jgi:hypothetical protein
MVWIVTITGGYDMSAFWSTVVGLVTGVLIGFTTDFFTSEDFKPVQETAKVSNSGAAINIITGFSFGLLSILPSVIGISIAMLIAYHVSEASGVISGIYGVGISAVGMLAISGMIVSADAYGPIVDNARGIAEMAGMGTMSSKKSGRAGFGRQYRQSHHERVLHQRGCFDRAGIVCRLCRSGRSARRSIGDQPAQPIGGSRCVVGSYDSSHFQRSHHAFGDA